MESLQVEILAVEQEEDISNQAAAEETSSLTCDFEDHEVPSWILTSDFVKQLKEDFPDDLLRLDRERVFDIPARISKDNVASVLDNIRFFGIQGSDELYDALFTFFVTVKDDEKGKPVKKSSKGPRTKHQPNKNRYDNGSYISQLLYQGFPEIDEEFFQTLVRSAHCIQVHDICPIKVSVVGFRSPNTICEVAAEKGLYHLLRFAHRSGCTLYLTDHDNHPIDLIEKSRYRNIECLKYLHEKGGFPLHVEACSKAAKAGNLDCLKYVYGKGCPWDESTCSKAAKRGYLQCLKYAYENGCPWDESTCSKAAKRGYLQCLKYAHENGCPWDEWTCLYASDGGFLDCLKYAYENGCPWDEEACWRAAGGGHLDCLKYAHENECPWDEVTINNACRIGCIDCLRYAHENGCPWDEFACYSAALGNHLECLKYCHENGCPWDLQTTDGASESGSLECLKYAFENGCSWCSNVTYWAAYEGFDDMLIYACEHDCEWDEEIRMEWVEDIPGMEKYVKKLKLLGSESEPSTHSQSDGD